MATEKLYMESIDACYQKEFEATVTSVDENSVVLDRTLFYPEGGGQLGDQGVLKQGNSEVKVLDTKISEDVVLHFTNSSLEIGQVRGQVDWERRKQLMDHHTAIHVVGGATRELLGPHIWQAGSNKGALYARIDVTHHSRINRDLLNDIEDRANEIISSNLFIEKLVLTREEADSKFSFDIYQGGPPKHDIIRIIKIGAVNAILNYQVLHVQMLDVS